ncbi:unnamed protein product [Amoebophrya sp. A25]|nr:unnamed protein product [Amoebophrya sp. A25]|eukprot:GSA25T00003545001.1
MRVATLACGLVSVAAIKSEEAAKNAAIDKVVEMLKEMESRGQKEKQEETVAFTAFSTWCSDTQAEKESDIKESERAIQQFQAQIVDAQERIAAATDAINEAVDTQEKMKENKKAMEKVRAEENTAYIAEHTDLSDSIYACDKAIEVLSSTPEKVEAASFVQQQMQTFQQSSVMQKSTKGKHWAAVESLVQTLSEMKDPFVSASERQSDTVIKMVQDLQKDFEEEKQDLTKEENERQHHFEMNMQDATQKQEAAAKMEAAETENKSNAEADFGNASKELATEEQSLADDKKYLAEVTADCKQKSSDYDARQKSRTEEMEAIAQAISIMSSPEIQSGSGHLDSAQSLGSFLQLRAGNKDAGDSSDNKLTQFLRSRGASLHSKILMELAESAEADPFIKIRKMIQELINKLKEEEKAELTKKGMCDKEMKENKAAIEEFESKVAKESTKVEKLTSNVEQLTASAEKFTKEIAQLKTDMAEAKKNRATEKADNEKTITETTAASKATDQAMTVLQNYYSKVEGAFVQVKVGEKQPAFEGGEYKGMGGGGVLGLLEVIKSQMDQLVRETTTAESEAASSHDKFMTEAETSKASKESSLNSTQEDLAQKKEDLINAKDALVEYKATLDNHLKEKREVIEPKCIAKGMSFEEKQKKRQEEIDSLKEAMEILAQM